MLETCRARSPRSTRRTVDAEVFGRPESVTVTHGAQEALFLLFDALLRRGDQVIAFNSGWQPLLGLPPRLGASVTVLPYGPDMSVDAAAVTAAAGENLPLIALNSPCNPTGLRVEEEELRALVALVAERDAYLLVDEEYAIDLSRSPAVGQDRVISVSGLSKTYGLPGLRTGWVYGAPQVAEACAERKFLTSIANSVLCEALACSALDRHEDYAREYHRLCAPGLGLVERGRPATRMPSGWCRRRARPSPGYNCEPVSPPWRCAAGRWRPVCCWPPGRPWVRTKASGSASPATSTR